MKNIFLSLSLVISAQVCAQADDILATIDWSVPMVKQYVNVVQIDSQFVYYAGVTKTGLFSYDQVFGRLNKDNLEKDLQIIKDAEKYKGEYPQSLGYKVRGNELFGFFEHYDKKSDKHSILVRKLLDNKRKMGPYKEIGALESKRKSKGDLKYVWSDNDSLLLLVGQPPLEEKYDNEKVIFTLLNYDYDEIFEAELELDFADKYFHISSYCVTNKGVIMLLGYKMPNKKKGEKKQKDKSNRDYYLYVLDQKTGELVEYDLGLKDKFINNISMTPDFKNNTTILNGIYGDSEFGSMAGSFFISLDQGTFEVSESKYSAFDKEFKVLMARNKRQAKKIKEGKEDEIKKVDVVLREVIKKPDGGLLVIFEDYDFWITTHSDGKGNTYTVYHYQYKDIFVLNYDVLGEIVWTAFLPKDQYSQNDDGMWGGYLLVVDKNRLHFIYNDHKKNEALWGTDKELKQLKKYKKGQLVMVSLSEEGEMEYNVLMPSRVDKFLISPRRSRMFGRNSNTGIITSYKGTSTRIGKLELFLND